MSLALARPAALVTGAQRGIGKAIALELARSGFDLALADYARAPELKGTTRTAASIVRPKF